LTHQQRLLKLSAFHLIIIFTILSLILTNAVAPVQAASQSWKSSFQFDGFTGIIQALAKDSQGNLYAAGTFTGVGGQVVNGIARWDGLNWNPVGSGIQGYVMSLAIAPDNSIYVGGSFSAAGGMPCRNIARWDQSSWYCLGSGTSGTVRALAVDNAGTLYVGGYFTTAGGLAAKNIAKWDGTSWSAMGTQIQRTVFALTIDNLNRLYAAADMDIYRWNGSSWGSPLGSTAATIMALAAAPDGSLYVGGNFPYAGPSTVNHIARLNGTTWSDLNMGTDGPVNALALDSSGNLYAGGSFANAGGVPASSVARWDGTAWHALDTGTNSDVEALLVENDGGLVVGGAFSRAGNTTAYRVARWSGSAWSAIGSTVSNTVNDQIQTFALDSQNNLIMGGRFTTAAGQNSGPLASWDGSDWIGYGSNMTGFPSISYAVERDGGNGFYVGGWIDQIGTQTINNIAHWNGSSWQPMSTGMTGIISTGAEKVNALELTSQGILFAGGGFVYSGGTTTNGVARWNGSVWEALGSGLSGTNWQANALAADSAGNVYVGGVFSSAGGTSASNIALWNDTTHTWSALGSGVNGSVSALVVASDGSLYAGGNFVSAGGAACNHVARWDGSIWSCLGLGTDGAVNALAIDPDGRLVVGGNFTNAGGSAANNIALWDGSSFAALDVGTDGPVNTLVFASASTLYVGGNFVFAGGQYSPFFAAWGSDSTPPGAIADLSVTPGPQSGQAVLSWTAPADDGYSGAPVQAYEIRYLQDTPIAGAAAWSSATSISGSPIPALDNPGTPQTVTLTGLPVGKQLFFNIRSRDSALNISDVSNTRFLSDIGFRPNPDGYPFRNLYGWKQGDLTFADLQAVYQWQDVCTNTDPAKGCTRNSVAQKWFNYFKRQLLVGGHCLGEAITSARLYGQVDGDQPSSFGASTTFDLTASTPVRQYISGYHIRQKSTNYLGAINDAKGQKFSDVVAQLITYLKGPASDWPVLVSYFGPKGTHAVMPYAVNDLGNGQYQVWVYENESPWKETNPEESAVFVMINTAEGTWSYNPNTYPAKTGTETEEPLAVIPMSHLNAPLKLLNSNWIPVQNKIQVGQTGGGDMLIIDPQGQRTGTLNGVEINEIPGAVLYPSTQDAGVSALPLYELPAGIAYTIRIAGNADSATQPSNVFLFQKGQVVSVEDITVPTESTAQISLSADGTQITQQASTNQNVHLSLAQDEITTSTLMDIYAGVQAGHSVQASVDQVSHTLIFSNPYPTSGSYELDIQQSNQTGELVFANQQVPIAPFETHRIDYSQVGQSTVQVQIDQGSDGGVDKTISVSNQVYQLTGTIDTAAGAGLPDVTISLSNGQTTISDSTGGYSFTGLSQGTYTITPSQAGMAFNPASRTVTLNADTPGQDFIRLESRVIFVKPGGVGSQDGASWENASDLQAALTGAIKGDEIWVAAGTYKPTTGSDRLSTFTLKNGVALYGGFVGHRPICK